jgi:hypothetical protein
VPGFSHGDDHGRMALSVGHATGALARANFATRERTELDKEDRRIARRALHRADALLDDLEKLQLRGVAEVPSWCGDRAAALRRASIQAGIRDPRLEAESGVIKLMDDVYTLEERLMRRLRLRTQRVVALVSA